MATLELFEILQKLTEDEFRNFKWYLKQDDILEGFKGIPVAQLETAARTQTVDLMVQKHQDHGALQLTKKVLEKIGRNDLVQSLQKFQPEPEVVKMTKLKQELWKTLQELNDDELFLNLEGIPVADVEKAERQDTVVLTVQKHQDHGALQLTKKVLEKISRNDLVQSLQNSQSGANEGNLPLTHSTAGSGPLDLTMTILETITGNDLGQLLQNSQPGPKDLKTQKILKLKWVQQFAVEVTLEHNTAHPNLILSDDGKQVHHGDVRKELPNNPERLYSCVNVLGKPSLSNGRFYYEVEVNGKTAWDLGVARESIQRKQSITTSPENGYWTITLRNEDECVANDDHPVSLCLNQPPQKVGVFVDYEEGLVCFYDVDAADLLYAFTDCSFTEKLYPFFSPCTNKCGTNSASRMISPVNHTLNLKTHDVGSARTDTEQIEYIREKAELENIQKFAVEVTLDPDTAHPALILSDDRKQVRCSDVCKRLPDSPKRFTKSVNVLGEQGFSSGRFYFEVQVKGKTEWSLGVAKESIKRKRKSITTSPEYGYWTMTLKDEYFANDDDPVGLCLNQPLQKVGVFVNYEEGLVCFYDVDTADLLYALTDCSFTEKLYPFFSPCTNDGGTNSAPLIISPVNHQLNLQTHDVGEQKEQYERKKADLKSMQYFAVEVTLDPDTAHPNLILSDDGKQVHHGDVRKKLPDNPKRFNSCVNVLGKQRFSSGKLYFEVQVKGKTAWTLGVAKKTVNRKGKIRLDPEDGFWTIWLRDGDKYVAKDKPSVSLSLKTHPQKVGVFVDYEEGLVYFYDVDAADRLYAFTDCSFTEKLVPYLSPCTNDDGRNSTPLIISPVNPTD